MTNENKGLFLADLDHSKMSTTFQGALKKSDQISPAGKKEVRFKDVVENIDRVEEQSESEREQYKPLKLFGLGTEVLPPKKIPIRNRSPLKAAAKASPNKEEEGAESDREYDQFL